MKNTPSNSTFVSYFQMEGGGVTPKDGLAIQNEVNSAVRRLETQGLEPFAAVPFPVIDPEGKTIHNGGVMLIARSRVVQYVESVGTNVTIVA